MCAGAAMSRALLYLIPDWPALSVACFRETREEPLKRPLSNLILDFRIVWPRTRRTWLTQLTPRLSRMRATYVCVSSHNWTRSCTTRMTSALAKSWSAMNCRGPTATVEVLQGLRVWCFQLGQVVHVTNFPLKRCYTQVVHVVNDDRFLWGSFRSNFRIGVFEFQQGKRAPSSGDT